MRAAALALPPLEIAVGGGGAPFTRAQHVRVHAQAHRASRLAPVESGLAEDAIEPLVLRLPLHRHRARHDHSVDAVVYAPAAHDARGGTQVLDPGVGAGANEDAIDANILDRRA